MRYPSRDEVELYLVHFRSICMSHTRVIRGQFDMSSVMDVSGFFSCFVHVI